MIIDKQLFDADWGITPSGKETGRITLKTASEPAALRITPDRKEIQAEFGDLEPGSEGYEAALEKEHSNNLLGCWNPMPHRGIRGRSFPQVLFAVAFATAISYRGLILPQTPVSDGTSPKCKRNAEIRARHHQGESIATLAEVFGITEQRIWQILNDRRK